MGSLKDETTKTIRSKCWGHPRGSNPSPYACEGDVTAMRSQDGSYEQADARPRHAGWLDIALTKYFASVKIPFSLQHCLTSTSLQVWRCSKNHPVLLLRSAHSYTPVVPGTSARGPVWPHESLFALRIHIDAQSAHCPTVRPLSSTTGFIAEKSALVNI